MADAPAPQASLELGLIGNCAASALIDAQGTIVWGCAPRFDSNPVFCRLLDGDKPMSDPEARGFFAIEVDDLSHSEQHYAHNTAILVTTLYDANGGVVQITDFAPRYKTFGRVFRPLTLVRIVRPVAGEPRITVRLRPAYDYGAGKPFITRGSNHMRYVGDPMRVRLTTEAPLTFVHDEIPFLLEEPMAMVLGPDETLQEAPLEIAEEFRRRTENYWHEWCRYLSVPFEWQEAVIRAAVTLKLCNHEESGAIVAAVTTSIPEAAGSGRNWDYRYCWLRDAFFVVHTLNRLGATKTMEGFLRWITNIVSSSANGRLQPVYGVTLKAELTESIVEALEGYRGMGPVRVGNQAYEHIQNDIYGSVILAATQSFFDARLLRPGTMALFERLERIGETAVALHDQPDAGLWEFRSIARIHTYTAVMAWAGCDRLSKIAHRLQLPEREQHWRDTADRVRRFIEEKCWNEERGCYVDSVGGSNVDASLLLMHELGFVAADDPRYIATVEAIGHDLQRGPYLFRYTAPDDFGRPANAFNICTFWYIDALAAIGRTDEARAMFENMLNRRNRLGLLSEDIDPKTGELWGNFPQTYSMVGLINSAMRLSRKWEEVL